MSMYLPPYFAPVISGMLAGLRMGGSRGGEGGLDPLRLKKHKSLEFLSNTGPDPLKNHKATKPEIISTPEKRHGPILVVFGLLPSSTYKKRSRSKLGPL